MSCDNCVQKLIEENEKKLKIFEEAKKAATLTGQWYAIYTDELGECRFIRADLAQNYPVKQYVSP